MGVEGEGSWETGQAVWHFSDLKERMTEPWTWWELWRGGLSAYLRGRLGQTC